MFEPSHLLRDATIRGRKQAAGGPYRVYSCPQCHRDSKVESTPKDRLYASPDREYSPLDYVFSMIERLSPKDFLRVAHWHQQHAEARQAFFERDGDTRYSKHPWSNTLRQWVGSKETPATIKQEEKAHRSQPPPSKKVFAVPHPYRILGLQADATEADIRAAFRTLARKYHPDKQVSADPKQLELANQRLQELLEAYDEIRSKLDGQD